MHIVGPVMHWQEFALLGKPRANQENCISRQPETREEAVCLMAEEERSERATYRMEKHTCIHPDVVVPGPNLLLNKWRYR